MLMIGITLISLMASYINVEFLGSALTFMIMYVWGRRNEDVKMSFFGFLTVSAPWVPWVMIGFSLLVGNSIVMDIIGICVGHMYYFADFVYPVLADVRGWKVKRIIETPAALEWICDALQGEQQA